MKKMSILVILVMCATAIGVVSSVAVPERFEANGSATTFNFTFRLTDQTEMSAIVVDDSTGVPTYLTLNIGYTLSATNNDFSNGGTLKTSETYDSGNTIVLHRNTLRTQSVNLMQGQAMPAESTETTFDKQTMAMQDIDKDLGFTITVPKSDPTTALDLELPNWYDRKGLVLGFDETTGSVTAVAALPTSSVTVSGFMETVLDDATAGKGRRTLGISYDVIGYGAGADGSNDSVEIQAAIDAANTAGGGVVFFPEGSYTLTSALVPKSNVTLEGEEGSIILFTGINAIDSSAAVANFTVRNLIFNGQLGESKGIYITDATSTFIRIENCEFENMGTTGVAGRAIEIHAANYVWIEGCNVHDCYSGIYVVNSNSAIIDKNQVRDIGPGAGDGQNCIVVWATADSAGDTSVEFATISNNICEDGTDNGIRITSQGLSGDGTTAGTVSYATVTGNLVNEMGNDCFRLSGNYITVTGNVAVDAGISAYRATGGSYVTIADNVATINSTRTSTISAAIYWVLTQQASAASNISITGNMINSDEWRSGIWVGGLTKHSGTSTSTNTNQLIDSTGTFETDEVYADNWVHNVTDNTWAQIVAVVSETVLTLDADIFSNAGDAFRVNAMGQGLVVANNTITDSGTNTLATNGALFGIDINYWFDVSVKGNRLDNTYEGISAYRCLDVSVKNNDVVNCADGSGRAIRTSTVTRAVVSGSYLHGNLDNYDLDTDDTRLIEPINADEFVIYEGKVVTYEGKIVTYIK